MFVVFSKKTGMKAETPAVINEMFLFSVNSFEIRYTIIVKEAAKMLGTIFNAKGVNRLNAAKI